MSSTEDVKGAVTPPAEVKGTEGDGSAELSRGLGQLQIGPKNPKTVDVSEGEKMFLPMLSAYLKIVIKERELKTVSSVLKDDKMGGDLVMALMDPSLQVVSSTLDVFEVLFGTRRNRAVLKTLPYFIPTLEKIIKNKEKYPNEIRRTAYNLLKLLRDKQPLADQSMSSRNNQNKNKAPVNKDVGTLPRKKPKNRETVLQVSPGLLQYEHNRTLIQKSLINVKGIISLTFDLKNNYCVIRGIESIPPEAFGVAVANVGYRVSLLSRNDLDEVVLTPIESDKKEESLQENLPDYPVLGDKFENSSNDALCKKSDIPKEEGRGSVLNSALNFVRSSFYW